MVTLLQSTDEALAAAALDAENYSSYDLADERAQDSVDYFYSAGADSAGESTYSDALY